MFKDRLERFKTACTSSSAYRIRWALGVAGIVLVISITNTVVHGWYLYGDPLWYLWAPGDDTIRFLPIRSYALEVAGHVVALVLYTLWIAPPEDQAELLAEGIHPDLREEDHNVN